MDSIDVKVAELTATVVNEAKHLNLRLDRNERAQDERHRDNVKKLDDQTERLTTIEGLQRVTNGQVAAHGARLGEGDKNFAALWRRMEGLGRRHAAPAEGDAEEKAIKRRDLGFMAIGACGYGGYELLKWLLP